MPGSRCRIDCPGGERLASAHLPAATSQTRAAITVSGLVRFGAPAGLVRLEAPAGHPALRRAAHPVDKATGVDVEPATNRSVPQSVVPSPGVSQIPPRSHAVVPSSGISQIPPKYSQLP